jgi:hypothetical protein
MTNQTQKTRFNKINTLNAIAYANVYPIGYINAYPDGYAKHMFIVLCLLFYVLSLTFNCF